MGLVNLLLTGAYVAFWMPEVKIDLSSKIFINSFVSIAKGLWVTLTHWSSCAPSVTELYPEQKPELPENYRGMPTLPVDPKTGRSGCIACGACARMCPEQIITVEVEKSRPQGPQAGGVRDRHLPLHVVRAVHGGLPDQLPQARTHIRTRVLHSRGHGLRPGGLDEARRRVPARSLKRKTEGEILNRESAEGR